MATDRLTGSETTAQLAPLENKGDTLEIFGTLNNSSATLSAGSGGEFAQVVLESGGTISGGTVQDAGSGLSFQGGTLDGVAYDGTLDLTSSSSSLHIADGLTATGANGTGPGTIKLGNYSDVYFDNTQTIDNATIALTGYGDYLQQYTTQAAYQANGNQYPNETLTLGKNLVVDQTGSSSYA